VDPARRKLQPHHSLAPPGTGGSVVPAEPVDKPAVKDARLARGGDKRRGRNSKARKPPQQQEEIAGGRCGIGVAFVMYGLSYIDRGRKHSRMAIPRHCARSSQSEPRRSLFATGMFSGGIHHLQIPAGPARLGVSSSFFFICRNGHTRPAVFWRWCFVLDPQFVGAPKKPRLIGQTASLWACSRAVVLTCKIGHITQNGFKGFHGGGRRAAGQHPGVFFLIRPSDSASRRSPTEFSGRP